MNNTEVMSYDVVIVGAGISAIAAAIKLKQQALENNIEISVAVFEKGSSVGANIISGCVMDPVGLDELLPNWRELNLVDAVSVTKEYLYYLTSSGEFQLPRIKKWLNDGCFIVSLSQLCVKLAEYAETLGVEIYPGFPVAKLLIEKNRVIGILTSDAGLNRDFTPKPNHQAGMMVLAKQVVLAEGARGSVTKEAIRIFGLDKNRPPQTYGLGIKEIWQVAPYKHQSGLVEHFMGYPLKNNAYGGGFIYHMQNNMVAIGLVTALDYKNPYFNPFEEFQKFKLHPKIKSLLNSAIRVEYGARTVVEGGIQAIPDLVFPGGVIIGDSAGFINVPRIKGVHNAIRSGILATHAIIQVLQGKTQDATIYQNDFKQSSIYKELYSVRNIRPAFRLGLHFGLVYTGFETFILHNKTPWTFRWKKTDSEKTKKKTECLVIDYPKPDNIITFDKASSVHLSNVSHDDSQPCHLWLKNSSIPIHVNFSIFASPETRYCPAGVYEIINNHEYKPQLQINSQNCIHCKACDIKDPTQNITWVPPEAGSGPQYSDM